MSDPREKYFTSLKVILLLMFFCLVANCSVHASGFSAAIGIILLLGEVRVSGKLD